MSEPTVKAALTRLETGPSGTFGMLVVTDGGKEFRCFTGELPWRANKTGVSCVPEGRYRVEWRPSRKGVRYRLLDVPGRSGILIHEGNWCGDASLGLRSDVEGCILLGENVAHLAGQKAVTRSRQALAAFHRFMRERPLDLVIVEKDKAA